MIRVGMHDVAIVTVVFVVPPTEQMVSGSAIVRDHLEPTPWSAPSSTPPTAG